MKIKAKAVWMNAVLASSWKDLFRKFCKKKNISNGGGTILRNIRNRYIICFVVSTFFSRDFQIILFLYFYFHKLCDIFIIPKGIFPMFLLLFVFFSNTCIYFFTVVWHSKYFHISMILSTFGYTLSLFCLFKRSCTNIDSHLYLYTYDHPII